MISARNLRTLGACKGSAAWASRFPNEQAAWDACRRGDWLLQYLGWTLPHSRAAADAIIDIAVGAARDALPTWEEHYPGDARPRRAIEAAEAVTAVGPAAVKLAAEHAASAAEAVRSVSPEGWKVWPAFAADAATWAAASAASAEDVAAAAKWAALAVNAAAAAAYYGSPPAMSRGEALSTEVADRVRTAFPVAPLLPDPWRPHVRHPYPHTSL